MAITRKIEIEMQNYGMLFLMVTSLYGAHAWEETELCLPALPAEIEFYAANVSGQALRVEADQEIKEALLDAGDLPVAQQSSKRKHGEEKSYWCEFCPYGCAYKSVLDRHTLTHTKEKLHQCKLCECRSARKSDLDKHMLTHTGEKQHQCKLCTYRCAEIANLKRHMLTHTGERPYQCQLCTYRCSQKYNLKAHMVTHTKKKLHGGDQLSGVLELPEEAIAHDVNVLQPEGQFELDRMLDGASILSVEQILADTFPAYGLTVIPGDEL